MKKPLLNLTVLAATASFAHGQGTIALGHSALTRINIRSYPDGTFRNCVFSDNIVVGVFYGPTGTTPEQLTFVPSLATIGSTGGVLANAPSVFALPGTEAGQIVSLQIRA
jgi:hypothetical protein